MDKKPAYLSEEYRNSLGRLLQLSDSEEKKIKKRLKKEIQAWKDATAPLHKKLERWNDLLEGVVEETEWPFPGSSNVHIPIIAIYCKVYHSIERRSILGSDNIWYIETIEDQLREDAPNIEEAMNYKSRNEWNIATSLSDVFWTTNRDGLGIMQISYVEEYEENVKDIVLIHSDQDFIEEFPTPEEAQMKPKEWSEMRAHVQENATNENPVEIPITYDKEIYRGPYGEVVELADFVICPATAPSISQQHARGYGKRFYVSKGQVKKKAREGTWYKEAVESFSEKSKAGSKISSYHKAKDDIDGLSRNPDNADECEFFELAYRIELKPGEGEKKLLLTYSFDHDELMASIEYPYRIDFYAFFRIEKRTNRLIGSCIPKELEDLNEEIDALHNQRVNSRKIAEVPSFKGKKGAKSDFDAGAEENLWKPGVIFWLEDPDAFQQFKVQPVDLNSSMAEEKNDMQISSLNVGVEPFLFSGNPSADNPDAPGNKTAILIQQSNLRMDDPISELREGVEQVGNICLAMEYQFGDPAITYVSSDDNGQSQTKSFSKRLLRKGIKMRMQGVTVALNPEAEFKKFYNIYQAVVAEPVMQQFTQGRMEILRRAFRAGRVPGRERILPNDQQIQQIEQAAAQAAAAAAQAQAQQQQQMDQLKMQVEQGKAELSSFKNQAAAKSTQEKAQVDEHAAKSKIAKQEMDLAVQKHLSAKKLEEEEVKSNEQKASSEIKLRTQMELSEQKIRQQKVMAAATAHKAKESRNGDHKTK